MSTGEQLSGIYPRTRKQKKSNYVEKNPCKLKKKKKDQSAIINCFAYRNAPFILTEISPMEIYHPWPRCLTSLSLSFHMRKMMKIITSLKN